MWTCEWSCELVERVIGVCAAKWSLCGYESIKLRRQSMRDCGVSRGAKNREKNMKMVNKMQKNEKGMYLNGGYKLCTTSTVSHLSYIDLCICVRRWGS